MEYSGVVLLERDCPETEAFVRRLGSLLDVRSSVVGADIVPSGTGESPPLVCVVRTIAGVKAIGELSAVPQAKIVLAPSHDGGEIGPVFSRSGTCRSCCWVAHMESLGYRNVCATAAGFPPARNATIAARALASIDPGCLRKMDSGSRYRFGGSHALVYSDTLVRSPYCGSCSTWARHASERFLEIL